MTEDRYPEADDPDEIGADLIRMIEEWSEELPHHIISALLIGAARTEYIYAVEDEEIEHIGFLNHVIETEVSINTAIEEIHEEE